MFSAVFVGFTWLGLVLIRPWVRRYAADELDWNQLIRAILATFAVFYGVTLAMIAVSTQQSFAAANQVVGREAGALGTLYRDVSSYPQPIRGELQAMLRDYTQYVIEEAWPAQQRGVIPEEGTARVSAFQQRLLSFQPQTQAEGVLHAETIGQFGVFVDYRRQRLQSISTGLPDVLWFVVGVGALLNAVLTSQFDVKRLRVHLLLELPSIGWLLFLPDSSPNDWFASCPTVVTFATRLLTEPLSRHCVRVCRSDGFHDRSDG